jgi:streptogramin lyase
MKAHMKNPLTLFTLVAGLSLMLPGRVVAQTYDTNNVIVQTFAGAAVSGYLDGQGQLAEFSGPSQIVADTSGNLYVWDSGNRVIRKITPDGTVSTFVGGGVQYQGYGTNVSLSSYLVGATMNMDHSNTIWMIAYSGGDWLLSIQTNGFVSIQNFDLPGMTANGGMDLCFDSANIIYYNGADKRIYRYDPDTGDAQVFAGSGISGHLDGNGIYSEFSSPSALVCDPADNIYVLDGIYLRKIDQSQNVTTVATNTAGAPLAIPQYMDNYGDIVCVNNLNNYSSYVSEITPTQGVLLYAGTTGASAGGYTNGPGNLARFYNTASACAAQGSIFVADYGNSRIRQITFDPQPQVVSAGDLGIATYAGVTIRGVVGRTYEIQSSPDLANWTTRAGFLLTTSPYLWFDPNPIAGNKFYRAFLLP